MDGQRPNIRNEHLGRDAVFGKLFLALISCIDADPGLLTGLVRDSLDAQSTRSGAVDVPHSLCRDMRGKRSCPIRADDDARHIAKLPLSGSISYLR